MRFIKDFWSVIVLMIGVSLILVFASGCSIFSVQTLNETKDKIELAIGQLGAGNYKATGTLYRNDAPLGTVTLTLTCRQAESGKLGGCTEPVVSFTPLSQ